MKSFLLSLLTIVLFWSCASSTKTVETSNKPKENSSAYDESFDPLSLNDNDVVIQKKEKETAAGIEAVIPVEKVAEEDPDLFETTEVDGYRVQILATKNVESATVIQQTAADQFSAIDHKSYLVFESPQYKIRIGDVTTRTEAEEIRDMAQDYGYKGAFIVRSKVTVKRQKK